MSYRYEKTEQGQDLVISGWEKGIGDSALTGHQQMQNVDIWTMPGVLMTGWKSTLASSTTSLVQWFRRDPLNSGEVYGITTAGTLYKGTGTIPITWSALTGVPSNNGRGLGIWKGYLILPRNTSVEASLLPVSSGATWTAISGITLTSTIWNPVYVGLNTDHCFIGNTYKVAQIIETSGSTFNPATGATYTATSNALDLPSYYNIQTIEGLGNNIYLGTFQGASAYTRMSAVIFPWDKVSNSYDNPIISTGTGVHQLKTIGSQMYTWIGNRSDMSVSNGTSTNLLKKFYNISFPNAASLTDISPDAIDALNDQEILIGIGRTTGNVSPLGVYSLRDGVHFLKNLPSTGSSTNIQIGAILSLDAQRYIFSWLDDNSVTYGIDLVGNSGRYSDYTTQVDTDLIPVATYIYPANFGEVEFKLASPLTTGQGIKLWYRKNLNDSFTLIDTWDFSTIGARMSFEGTASITDAQWIQFRVQLASNTSSDTSPQLTEIRLRK